MLPFGLPRGGMTLCMHSKMLPSLSFQLSQSPHLFIIIKKVEEGSGELSSEEENAAIQYNIYMCAWIVRKERGKIASSYHLLVCKRPSSASYFYIHRNIHACVQPTSAHVFIRRRAS